MQVPVGAQWSSQFTVDQATQAWIDTLSAVQRAHSDAYFEGGYWLLLWNLLWGLAVAAWLLSNGRSARLRDWVARLSSRVGLQTLYFAVVYVVLAWLLTLPLDIYQNYFRERQYGLATQTFIPWFTENLLHLGVEIVLTTPLIALLYWMIRRMGRTWWAGAAVLCTAFLVFVIVISPVFIQPLFNQYKPLPDGAVRSSILSLARANGIPTHEVYEFDASRQTTRISANVSGALGTTRVSLNDNLLHNTSLPEIRAVMGHEMGHYVLHHVWRLVVYLGLLLLIGFMIISWAQDRALARWGGSWKLQGRQDVAALPLMFALFSLVQFLGTPAINGVIRISESEADIFGLNAAREPQAFASVALRLSTYRKISPGPIEEILFYDHPSGHTRIRMAMQWLNENHGAP